MSHKMGLAQFTLGSITIPTTITYLNNTETNRTGSNTITASNSFNGFTPFDNSGTYLYLIRPATSTSLNSNTGTDQWTSALTYNIASGSTATQTAYSRRHNWPATTSATWNYDYQGREYSLTIPVTGTYKLECWGAQGGNTIGKWDSGTAKYYGGYGGYSVGTVSLSASSVLFISAGSQGEIDPSADYIDKRTFNGGGIAGGGNKDKGDNNGGGGATHIATMSGLLRNLSSQMSKILIVAGGGGSSYGYWGNSTLTGNYCGNGGHGGGYIGNTGQFSGDYYWLGSGGTQSGGGTTTAKSNYVNSDGYSFHEPYSRGTFGQGGIAAENLEDHGFSGAGGGGGYYGGAPSHYAGGGGGSGYIGNSLLSNKHMAGYGVSTSNSTNTKTISVNNVSSTPTADYAKQGAGYARISITF